MRVLYISSKRSEEKSLLSRIKGLEFREVKIHLRSSAGPILFFKIIDILDNLKAFNPDLMLFESIGVASFVAASMGKFYRIPLIVRVKGDPWKEYSEIRYEIPPSLKMIKKLNYLTGRWVLKQAHTILPNADHLHTPINKITGMRKKIYTVPISFRKPEEVPSIVLGANGKEFILTITNFNFWGKVEPLANAINCNASCLHRHGLSWIILGDGFFFEKFKTAINGPLEEGLVRLPGRQPVYPYYKNAKSLFYISGLDGLPNVILEAMYYKLAIVINHDCPAVELIKDGYNGLVVDFQNRRQVSGILKRLKSDEKELKALRENAYKYLERNFSNSKISSELEIALKQCK